MWGAGMRGVTNDEDPAGVEGGEGMVGEVEQAPLLDYQSRFFLTDEN